METIIGNCTVSIEDGNCYVERDGYVASLAALESTGRLYKDDVPVRISSATIKQIVAYAEKSAVLCEA